MINSLTLTNFKKHEALTINFGEGLVALKGPNEGGKSTLYHAIIYAFFGARALPMSLAETVTYGKPETSLRVQLVFNFEGATYTIIRSKSGATMTSANSKSSGHAEVTKAVEALLGVTADAASKLMVASQNGLRGALESKSAVPLIEKLSDISLIDNLITKIQDTLPCGNTKAMLDTAAVLDAAKRPQPDFADKEAAHLSAQTNFRVASEGLQEAQDALVPVAEVVQANATLRSATAALEGQERDKQALAAAQNRLAPPALVCEDQTATLLHKQAAQAEEATTLALYGQWQRHKPATEFADSNLPERIGALRSKAQNLDAKLADLRTDTAVAITLRINDKSCSLCGKDLQDVPEVVSKNATTDAKVVRLNLAIQEKLEERAATNLELKRLEAIQVTAAGLNVLAARLGKYVEVEPTVPVTIRWVAPVPEVDPTDYAVLLKNHKADLAKAAVDVAERSVAQANAAKLGEKLASFQAVDTAPATALLDRALAAVATCETQKAVCADTDKALATARHALELATALHTQELAAYEASRATLAALRTAIATHDTNNALIRRLREVRPIVASRLWAVVLGAMSSYFSQIRGARTVITMTADSFLADGRPVEGLSGSTLDALGLAIRVALGRTFLPSIDFLLLDEPAAGMDDEREAAMLGLLASCNYAQTVVITHSTLADTFARNVVQL